MSYIEIIKIIFGVILSIGVVVLLLLSYFVGYKYLIMEKNCINKTRGIIKKYTLSYRGSFESGIHLPVVFYKVNKKEYKVVGPEYKTFITITKNTPFSKNNIKYSIDNEIFKTNITTNSFVRAYKNPIEDLYPINSEIDVYYDPSNPKLSYVLRYCNKKYIFWLFLIIGLIVLIIDILILILL